ncbi:GNAT family N-acetyltransferase [Silvimonas iriomotensis]|uniref:N-acetyltransferase n=1 Tax=Silvimonas iriomotensis TaxID=449662 RepID=A0ABQ2P6K1_9NEIS|nr:GNAT family N-acetyltransferase [Silvimonas iriomotensis]GGP19086.1 N-acetyltransferase [Silvimonas iriomotensis]
MLQHPDSALVVRPATLFDLPAIDLIQRLCYQPVFHEPVETFAARLRLSPGSSWVAEAGGQVLGYFFTHPWTGEAPPPLGKTLEHLPQHQDTHFLHDLAVHPHARGRGVAPRLIEAALHWGKQRGLKFTRLVAVAGAAPFWRKWGFKPVAAAPAYGDDAALMALSAENQAITTRP